MFTIPIVVFYTTLFNGVIFMNGDIVKALRWLTLQFPYITNPSDDSDRLCNCIYLYCSSAISEIESLRLQLNSSADSKK